jgi:cobalt-zinc-cadmium efflux system outer membrane protein
MIATVHASCRHRADSRRCAETITCVTEDYPLRGCVLPWMLCTLVPLLAARGVGMAEQPSSAAAAVENITPIAVPKQLMLKDAVELALLHNPGLAAFGWKVRAAEGKALQAGLRPNPELSLELEDVRLSDAPDIRTTTNSFQVDATGENRTQETSVEKGAKAGFGGVQTTLRLGQVIEIGGKRVKRLRLAERERDLAQWDYEAARLNVVTKAAKAFIGILGGQEEVALARKTLSAADEVLRVASLRVEAGKASPLEVTKAETQRAAAQVALDRILSELDTAREGLASIWGANAADFDCVIGSFEVVNPAPSLEELTQMFSDNPDIARWVDEIESRQAAFEVERSRRLPDVTVGLGLRRLWLPSSEQESTSFDSAGSFGESRSESHSEDPFENLLVFDVAVPLPLFDRNQGNIAAAESDMSRARAERREAEVEARSALHAAQQALAQSYKAVQSIRKDIAPRAQDAFERTQEGYQQGKFSYLDVLDAQRTQFDVQAQYLQALTAYHLAAVEIDRLLGRRPDDKEAAESAASGSEETSHAKP